MSKNTIQLLSFLFLLGLFQLSDAQVLYEENFNIPGEGIMGPQPPTIQIPSGAWSLTGDFSGLTASSDYVMTMTDGGESFLEAQDTDAVICFESDPIDISSYDSVKLSASLSELGDLESSDFFDLILWVDGEERLIQNYQNLGSALHTLTGDKPDDEDFGEIEVVEKLQGNSLIIKICFKNNAGTEQLRIHQLKVEALDVPAPEAEIGSFSLINAQSNLPIAEYDPIANAAHIDLMAIGTALINFRYNASPKADRVKFGISRQGFKIESIDDEAPYSLFGDLKGNYLYPPRDFLRLLWLTAKGPLNLYALEYEDGQSFPFRKTHILFDLSIGSRPLREGPSELSNAFELFPNPTNGNTILQLLPDMREEELEVFVYNTQGQLLHHESLARRMSVKLDLEKYPKGLYFVKLQGADHQFVKRLFLQ